MSNAIYAYELIVEVQISLWDQLWTKNRAHWRWRIFDFSTFGVGSFSEDLLSETKNQINQNQFRRVGAWTAGWESSVEPPPWLRCTGQLSLILMILYLYLSVTFYDKYQRQICWKTQQGNLLVASPSWLRCSGQLSLFPMILYLTLCFMTNIWVVNMKFTAGESACGKPLLAEVHRATVRSENRCGPKTHYTLPPVLAIILSTTSIYYTSRY